MKYRVKLMRPDSGLVVEEAQANSRQELLAQFSSAGVTVISIQPLYSLSGSFSAFGQTFPLVMFSQKFLVLLDAGMTQVEAIETIMKEDEGSPVSKVLHGLVSSLYEGKSLSNAMMSFPREFPRLYTELVKSSERTGNIGESLKQYIKYQHQVDLIKKKIVNASIYPMILVGAGSLVTMFLLFYVVPKFSLIYQDLGHDLPFFSKLLMQFGNFCNAHLSSVLITTLLMIISAVAVLVRSESRAWLLNRIKRIPTIGHQIHLYQLALFYRTIGMLLKGGLPIVGSIEMVSGVLEPDLRAKLVHAKQSIVEGNSASISFEKHGLTTPIALSLLKVGEKTGRLGDMSEYIADYYDEQTSRWVEWFTKLFEPLLMSAIGIVIGLIVVMMYFPIFELAGSLQ